MWISMSSLKAASTASPAATDAKTASQIAKCNVTNATNGTISGPSELDFSCYATEGYDHCKLYQETSTSLR
jgi:hypothetical protein